MSPPPPPKRNPRSRKPKPKPNQEQNQEEQDPYYAMSYIELRKLCREKGLSYKGKKVQLIQRLKESESNVVADVNDGEEDVV